MVHTFFYLFKNAGIGFLMAGKAGFWSENSA